MRAARNHKLLTVMLAVAATPLLAASASSAAKPAGCTAAEQSIAYGVGRWPSSCWRPYSSSSPFNQTIGRRPSRVSNSHAIVRHLVQGGKVSSLIAGDPDSGGSPTYYAQPGDPVYRLHCSEPWGRCEVEGMRIAVPARAMPTGGLASAGNEHDAHMTVIDQATGWEYDLWHVTKKSPSGGSLVFGWGGRTRIEGRGLGSGGVAAGYGNLAGLIRAQELERGRIEHALTIEVPCVRGRAVYPAAGRALSCARAGLPARNAPRLGARFQLQVTRLQLERMPAWKRAIAQALHRYGAYVDDTTGNPDWWGFSVEGPATYISFGYPDPLAGVAQRLGFPPVNYIGNRYREYWFKLSSGIRWRGMRVLRPCTTRGTC